MCNIEYANAYSEVIGILKYIPTKDYNKIPKNRIELFELNSNKNYSFNYNPTKTLKEQNVSKRAQAIMAILYRDYWASDIERKKILESQARDREILENQKKSSKDIEEIFKARSDNFKIEKQEMMVIQPVKKDNILDKIISRIKQIFKH